MSGVYISGRKPPNSCDDCWVSDCPHDEHIDGYKMMCRPSYCPLIPVPDHGRLIDEQDALKAVEQGAPTLVDRVGLSKILFDAPTIIPADKEEKE